MHILHYTKHPSACMPVHYSDVIMRAIAAQITVIMVFYPTVCSGTDQRVHQSSTSLAFVGGNSTVTGEFPAQKTSNEENVSIWWRHHVETCLFNAISNNSWHDAPQSFLSVFQPPQPLETWQGTLNCQQPGPSCPQISYYSQTSPDKISEDCLTLNIYVPYLVSTTRSVLARSFSPRSSQ